MAHSTADKQDSYHEEGFFILPNPSDVGRARFPMDLVGVASSVDAVVTRSDGESRWFPALPAPRFYQYVADGAIANANKPPYLIDLIGAVETTPGRRL